MSNASISGNTSGQGKNSNGRGSIYPIKLNSGETRYRAAIHDINGKRRTKNIKKKAEAEDWLAMQRQSRNHGLNTYATNPKMTVGDYLLGWVESHKSMVKHSTYKSYKSCIKNQINPRIGKQIAANLTTKLLRIFMAL